MASNLFASAAPAGTVSQPPSSGEYFVDRGFRMLALVCAVVIMCLCV